MKSTSQAAVAALTERFDRIALDFVNSRLHTRFGTADPFATPDGVLTWMDMAGVDGWDELRPTGPSGARLLRDEAVHLRHCIDALLAAAADGRTVPGPQWLGLARALRWASTSFEAESGPGEPFRLRRRYRAADGVATGSLMPIALDAIRLADEADPDRLRRCQAEECTRWFLDTSKGGQRRWCSMATCGNRAKAARYRERHLTDA